MYFVARPRTAGLFLHINPNYKSVVKSAAIMTARCPQERHHQPISVMMLTHRPCLRSTNNSHEVDMKAHIEAHYYQYRIVRKKLREQLINTVGTGSVLSLAGPTSRHDSMAWPGDPSVRPAHHDSHQRRRRCYEERSSPAAGVVAAAKEDDMVYRGTVYDHGDWSRHRSNGRHSRHMLAMATSRVVAGLLPPVLKLTMVASLLVMFNMLVSASCPLLGWVPGVLHVSSLPFQLAAPALALLLVFRTNASYGRFDEARKAWASIVNRSRDMARQAVTFLQHPADVAKLHGLLQYLMAFPYCLKDHLTHEDDLRKELSESVRLEEADLKAIMASPHRPNYVLQTMTQIIHSSHLTDMQKALLDSNVTNLHDNVGGCERIFSTPIPLSYTRLTSRILVIWHLLLPLALWDQCSWVTIPATFLSAAALFCIEEVGVLIEEPFSILPLATISNTIRSNVHTILHQHKEISERPRFLKIE